MKNKPLVSIVIAFYVDIPRFYLDLKKFSLQTYKNYEILVVTDDKKLQIQEKNVRVLWTKLKRTGPAEKRDFALKKAKGTICAFIDDDAYPEKHWLKNAVSLFNNHDIAAVGGPGITPKEDGYREQITGLVYESYFCSGLAQYRFRKMRQRYVSDYPAYNLLVKKSILLDVGGYGNHFYGGEDTFLCLKIVKAGYKILYSPKVLVYHHRRPLLLPYLRQIANIGKHRGYFAKKYPETSRSLWYMLPSILGACFLGGIFLGILSGHWYFVLLYILLGFVPAFISINSKNLVVKAIGGGSILLTHIVYGFEFILGFATNKLER